METVDRLCDLWCIGQRKAVLEQLRGMAPLRAAWVATTMAQELGWNDRGQFLAVLEVES